MGSSDLTDSGSFSERFVASFKRVFATIVQRIKGFYATSKAFITGEDITDFEPNVLERPTFKRVIPTGSPLPGAYTGVTSHNPAAEFAREFATELEISAAVEEVPLEAVVVEEEEESDNWLLAVTEAAEELSHVSEEEAAMEVAVVSEEEDATVHADAMAPQPISFELPEPDTYGMAMASNESEEEAVFEAAPMETEEEEVVAEAEPEPVMVYKRSISMNSPLARVLSTPTGSGAGVASPSSGYVFDFDSWDWDTPDAEAEIEEAQEIEPETLAPMEPLVKELPSCTIWEHEIAIPADSDESEADIGELAPEFMDEEPVVEASVEASTPADLFTGDFSDFFGMAVAADVVESVVEAHSEMESEVEAEIEAEVEAEAVTEEVPCCIVWEIDIDMPAKATVEDEVIEAVEAEPAVDVVCDTEIEEDAKADSEFFEGDFGEFFGMAVEAEETVEMVEEVAIEEAAVEEIAPCCIVWEIDIDIPAEAEAQEETIIEAIEAEEDEDVVIEAAVEAVEMDDEVFGMLSQTVPGITELAALAGDTDFAIEADVAEDIPAELALPSEEEESVKAEAAVDEVSAPVLALGAPAMVHALPATVFESPSVEAEVETEVVRESESGTTVSFGTPGVSAGGTMFSFSFGSGASEHEESVEELEEYHVPVPDAVHASNSGSGFRFTL